MARVTIERNISYDDVRDRYYVCMDRGMGPDGRRIRQYRTYKNLTVARSALREFHLEQEQERETPKVPDPTLEEWLEEWMHTIIRPNRAATTTYSYQNIIDRHLVPALGNVRITELTPGQIQTYYVTVAQEHNLSSNTVRRHHDLLASALKVAVRQGKLLGTPMDRVEPPRVHQAEIAFYTSDQLRTLYQQVEGHYLELPVRLAGSLGLRREELCGLKWHNVNFQRRVVCIREARTVFGANVIEKETKNRASVRTLYMADDVMELLQKEQERQKQMEKENTTGHVVLDRKGNPYSPNVLSLAFTRFIRSRGLPRVTLHGLRHSFATIASVQGASLFDIGKALGHSTPATTGRIYTHLVDRTHEDILQRVSDALK